MKVDRSDHERIMAHIRADLAEAQKAVGGRDTKEKGLIRRLAADVCYLLSNPDTGGLEDAVGGTGRVGA